MKVRNKLSVILIIIMIIGMLAGCGSRVDVSAYVKSILDVRYKNDSTTYVEMKFGTEEEAEKAYNEGMDKIVNEFVKNLGISEEMTKEYRQILADVSASVKYTVGEAVKQEDGGSLVHVTYEKMNLFVPFEKRYKAAITAAIQDWIAEMTAQGTVEFTQEEMEIMMNRLMFETMAECLKDTLAEVTWQEPQTATVTVTVKNRTLHADEQDLEALDKLFYDGEEADR